MLRLLGVVIIGVGIALALEGFTFWRQPTHLNLCNCEFDAALQHRLTIATLVLIETTALLALISGTFLCRRHHRGTALVAIWLVTMACFRVRKLGRSIACRLLLQRASPWLSVGGSR
jgi:hypothetical protein